MRELPAGLSAPECASAPCDEAVSVGLPEPTAHFIISTGKGVNEAWPCSTPSSQGCARPGLGFGACFGPDPAPPSRRG